MERSFATSIEPVIETTLGFLDEITARPADWDLAQVKNYQTKVIQAIRMAETQLKPRDETSWKRVKYALVGWIDEQCIALPWQGREWWKNNSLEVAFFKTKNSHDDFYVEAEEAIRMQDRNAIEACFLCVVLGFRGIYLDLRSKNPEFVERAKEFISRHQLKNDLRDWLRRTAEYLPIGQSTSRLKLKTTEGYGAPPLSARTDFVSAALFAVLGLGILLGYLYLRYLNG